MSIALLVIVLLFALIGWAKLSNSDKATVSTTQPKKLVTTSVSDKYEVWLKVFSEEKSNIREFDLFGTKAAIAWNNNDVEIIVICITAFRNGKPITNKFDYFGFNVKDKYWTGVTPTGSPARIREELKSIGLL